MRTPTQENGLRACSAEFKTKTGHLHTGWVFIPFVHLVSKQKWIPHYPEIALVHCRFNTGLPSPPCEQYPLTGSHWGLKISDFRWQPPAQLTDEKTEAPVPRGLGVNEVWDPNDTKNWQKQRDSSRRQTWVLGRLRTQERISRIRRGRERGTVHAEPTWALPITES